MTDNIKTLFATAPEAGSTQTEVLAEVARVMREMSAEGNEPCGAVVCVFGGQHDSGTHMITWVLQNVPVRHALAYAAACINERALP